MHLCMAPLSQLATGNWHLVPVAYYADLDALISSCMREYDVRGGLEGPANNACAEVFCFVISFASFRFLFLFLLLLFLLLNCTLL